MGYSKMPDVNYVPTLVIDTHSAAAWQLVHQLKHAGFPADAAVGHSSAIAAVRAQYYGSIIFIGDLNHPTDLRCVAELRRRVPRTWIIAVSSTAMHDTRELFLRYGIDALLSAPFSMHDLTSRLSAFSLLSRPP